MAFGEINKNKTTSIQSIQNTISIQSIVAYQDQKKRNESKELKSGGGGTVTYSNGTNPYHHDDVPVLWPKTHKCFRQLSVTLYIKVTGNQIDWQLDPADGTYKSTNTKVDVPGCGLKSVFKKECKCLEIDPNPNTPLVPGYGQDPTFTFTNLGNDCIKLEKVWAPHLETEAWCLPGADAAARSVPMNETPVFCLCQPSWEIELFPGPGDVIFHITPPGTPQTATVLTALDEACTIFKDQGVDMAAEQNKDMHCCFKFA
jgi:hypothetical protein